MILESSNRPGRLSLASLSEIAKIKANPIGVHEVMVHPVDWDVLPEKELLQSADGGGPEGGHGPVDHSGRRILLHLGHDLEHVTITGVV